MIAHRLPGLKISEGPIVSVVPTVLCTKASSACKVEDVSVENYVCTCQQSSDFSTVKARDNRQADSSTRKSATRMDFTVCVCVRAMRNTRTSACPWHGPVFSSLSIMSSCSF